MSKKYTIRIPSKCQKCDKKDNCEFVKTILKKPFDITGIQILKKIKNEFTICTENLKTLELKK